MGTAERVDFTAEPIEQSLMSSMGGLYVWKRFDE